MEFRTEESREKLHGVQDGKEQKEDTGSSELKKEERRYMEFKTEQNREEIHGVQNGRKKREET